MGFRERLRSVKQVFSRIKERVFGKTLSSASFNALVAEINSMNPTKNHIKQILELSRKQRIKVLNALKPIKRKQVEKLFKNLK